jgi:hypothetical protein
MPAEREYTSVLVISSIREREKRQRKKKKDLSVGFFFS